VNSIRPASEPGVGWEAKPRRPRHPRLARLARHRSQAKSAQHLLRGAGQRLLARIVRQLSVVESRNAARQSPKVCVEVDRLAVNDEQGLEDAAAGVGLTVGWHHRDILPARPR
jgi:hypothetical protein